MKKIISCILILAAIFALTQPAFAAQPPCAEPQYTNATSVYVTLRISSSGKATITLHVNGKAGLKNTSVTAHLEKKVGSSWVPVKDLKHSTSSRIFTKVFDEQLSSTGQYRVVADFTLTATTVEYITDTQANRSVKVNDTLAYIESQNQYQREIAKLCNFNIVSDEITFENFSATVDGSICNAEIQMHYSYDMTGEFEDTFHLNCVYYLTLEKESNGWRIVSAQTSMPNEQGKDFTYSNYMLNWAWDNVNGFLKLIWVSDHTQSGPQGYYWFGLAQASAGDVIIWDTSGSRNVNNGDYDHAMFITHATGTSGSRGVSNIYIAANTAPTTSAYMPLAQYCSYSASCFATAHITGGYYRI